MELRHIRYFLALAEELNFSRAAKKSHITQPPFSRQIQELEDEIGTKLFYRTKRYVELTEAGKTFRVKAYQILEQVEQACIDTRLSSTGKEGELRIGFTGAVQDLIPTVQEYHKRYPKIGTRLKYMSNTEQIQALIENQIDIGFISESINNKEIKSTPIKKMRYMLALPNNHALISKQSIYLSDLADEIFVMTPKSVGILYYEKFMNIFEKVGFTPNIAFQADDFPTVLALVAAGTGITLSPSPSISIDGIIKRKVEDLDLTVEGLIAHRTKNNSKIVNEFLSFFFEFHHEEIQNIDN